MAVDPQSRRSGTFWDDADNIAALATATTTAPENFLDVEKNDFVSIHLFYTASGTDLTAEVVVNIQTTPGAYNSDDDYDTSPISIAVVPAIAGVNQGPGVTLDCRGKGGIRVASITNNTAAVNATDIGVRWGKDGNKV